MLLKRLGRQPPKPGPDASPEDEGEEIDSAEGMSTAGLDEDEVVTPEKMEKPKGDDGGQRQEGAA